MKYLLLIAIVITSCTSFSAEFYVYDIPSASVQKIEAMRSLLLHQKDKVYRCNEVELTEKMTLKTKK